ncbi:sugar phosphate isomerase/epimerase family protein [Vreelandella alkaliphila]|uniref:sugar phosphate isomerase/epimerase family protein n=1 Tax=Vreelandella alkaliphila TaxID=272774 RepID=UPI003FD88F31
MIRLHLCTISFRHHLISLPELAAWAASSGFDGIELWGAHARHLLEHSGHAAEAMRRQGLIIPMISDYLPLEGPETHALTHTRQLCRLAHHWGATKVRTFAGHRPSAELSGAERTELARRLRGLTECVAQEGLTPVVEIHPNTLADDLQATLALLEAVDHPALGVNFDVLHVWEAGIDPLSALRELAPWVRHFHLKNIARRDQLGVFAPANVYSPAGSREGMVPVLEGACDYGPIIDWLAKRSDATPMDVSLEWFGPDCWRVLSQDLRRLRARLSPQLDQAALACSL